MVKKNTKKYKYYSSLLKRLERRYEENYQRRHDKVQYILNTYCLSFHAFKDIPVIKKKLQSQAEFKRLIAQERSLNRKIIKTRKMLGIFTYLPTECDKYCDLIQGVQVCDPKGDECPLIRWSKYSGEPNDRIGKYRAKEVPTGTVEPS